MSTLAALIFDVDGTLADTEELHRRAFNLAFDDFGLDWHWSPALYQRLLSISGGRERMLAWARSSGAGTTSDDLPHLVASIHQHKTACYGRLLRDGAIGLRPGVRRLLTEARAEGLRLAIATSTALSNVRALLDANLPSDWPEWFDVVASADVVATKKPSPAVYRYVLASLGLPAGRCIAFEDTLNGLRAATGAGLATVITPHAYTVDADFDGALLVADHLDAVGRTPHGAPEGGVDLPLLRALLGEARGRHATSGPMVGAVGA